MKQLQNDDIFFMNQAISEARRALEIGEVPIGAVVVCGKTVVGRGHNMVERLSDPTAHAEMQAITAATETIGGKYLNECTLYVTVEPCPMCAAASAWAQVGRIVYGADDPKRGFSRFGSAILHPKTKVERGVCADECSKIVTDFFREIRR